jgi:hypothetical protein
MLAHDTSATVLPETGFKAVGGRAITLDLNAWELNFAHHQRRFPQLYVVAGRTVLLFAAINLLLRAVTRGRSDARS